MADSADTTNPTGARKCSIDGCDRKYYKSGFCHRHHYRVLTYGSPHIFKRERGPGGLVGTPCSVKGCDRLIGEKSGGGMCTLHRTRLRKGTPLDAPLLAKHQDRIDFFTKYVSYTGDDCLIWPFRRSQQGYAPITWKRQKTHAHRVMCELAHGSPPFPRADAAHSCGRGQAGCVNPKHLRWATRQENMLDKRIHGTAVNPNPLRGADNGRATLTNEQVRTIYADPRKPGVIAKEYGCQSRTISEIKYGWRWRSVTGHQGPAGKPKK